MSLFKYMHESRIEDILVVNKIRFTQPVEFNDPFEVKLTIKGVSSKENIEKYIENDSRRLLEELYNTHTSLKYMLDFNSFLEFAQANKEKMKKEMLNIINSDKFHKQIKERFDNRINNGIGILSLTSEEKNLLMWAHYGNQHKGFVLQFDNEHSFFGKYKSKNHIYNGIQKVIYSEKRPYNFLEDFNNEKLFLTKSKEWEYEDEYRVIKNLKDADEVKNRSIYLFKFPKDLIKAIYCGCNMDIVIKKKILTIIDNDKDLNHVKVFSSSISDKYYKLEFEQIR